MRLFSRYDIIYMVKKMDKTNDNKTKVNNFFKNIFAFFLEHLLIPILAGGTTCTAIVGYIKKQFNIITWILLIICIIVIIIGWIVVENYNSSKKKLEQQKIREEEEKHKLLDSYECCIYDDNDISPKFRIHNLHVEYKLVKKNNAYNLTFVKSFYLESLQDDIDCFYEQRKWTGTVQDKSQLMPTITINEESVRVERHPYRVGTSDYFRITYSKKFNKGEHYFYKSCNNIRGTTKGEPFIAIATDHPTDNISFSIEVPRECRGNGIEIFVYQSGESSYELNSERKLIQKNLKFSKNSKSGSVNFEITSPKRFRYYLISWKW